MEHTKQPASSPTFSNFAGLLASLASARKQVDSAWSEDGLADDVATISYENALKTQARQTSAPPTEARTSEESVGKGVMQGLDPRHASGNDWGPDASSDAPVKRAAVSAPVPRPLPEQGLKSASITIRMSEAECAQLRQRAAEAGLTVSAYLRSCAFEMESLRAQVKETVAQLRAASAEQAALREQPKKSMTPETSPGHRFWPFQRHVSQSEVERKSIWGAAAGR